MSDIKFDYSKLWSCVGSAGAVNPADSQKVVLSNSAVQLGPSLGGIVQEKVARAAAPPVGLPTETIQAVIRYGVTPVTGVSTSPEYQSQESYQLGLRCRIGQGTIVARLIQVNVESGEESVMTVWNSEQFIAVAGEGAREFPVYTSEGGVPYAGPPADFVRNAYYVELTLSAKVAIGIAIHSPPAVSVIQWLNPKAQGQLGA
jgi:hypothetical protein